MSDGRLYPPFPDSSGAYGSDEPHFARRRRYMLRRPDSTRLHRPGQGNSYYNVIQKYRVSAEVSNRLLRAKGYAEPWMLAPTEPIPIRCHLWMPFWGYTADDVLHEMSAVRDEIKGHFLHASSRRHVNDVLRREIRYVYVNGFIRRIPDEIINDQQKMDVLVQLMIMARGIGNLMHAVPNPYW